MHEHVYTVYCDMSIFTMKYKQFGNRILNYKEAVNSLYSDDEIPFMINTCQCECANFCLWDPSHKQISTGDPGIFKNGKHRIVKQRTQTVEQNLSLTHGFETWEWNLLTALQRYAMERKSDN